MHCYKRSIDGIDITINVNSDWSGDADVRVVDEGEVHSVTVDAADLWRGSITREVADGLPPRLWTLVVAFAAMARHHSVLTTAVQDAFDVAWSRST